MTKKKLLIIAAANNFHFIRDIAEAMRDEFEIVMADQPCYDESLYRSLFKFDTVWIEWFDGLIEFALKFKNPNNKYIIRLHRYELFTPRTLAMIQDVTDSGAYKNIDKLVFVSEAVRSIGIAKFPWMAENSVVIPNLFDHTKFPLVKKDKGYNLLFLGRISYVKNLPLCLTMFHELLKLDGNYKLHIVGEIADPELKYYVENFITKTKIGDNIILHGHIPHERLSALMADMNYIICTSIFESQGLGIIEGMATSLKPVVFDFPGAEQFYPEKWRWTDRTDFVLRIMADYNPQEYHDYSVEKFSIQENVLRYKNLINEVTGGG